MFFILYHCSQLLNGQSIVTQESYDIGLLQENWVPENMPYVKSLIWGKREHLEN